jgi:hypothetical protein
MKSESIFDFGKFTERFKNLQEGDEVTLSFQEGET